MLKLHFQKIYLLLIKKINGLQIFTQETEDIYYDLNIIV